MLKISHKFYLLLDFCTSKFRIQSLASLQANLQNEFKLYRDVVKSFAFSNTSSATDVSLHGQHERAITLSKNSPFIEINYAKIRLSYTLGSIIAH